MKGPVCWDTSAIRKWLRETLAEHMRVPPASIAGDQPFWALGVDSRLAVLISGDLGEWLGRELAPTALFDYPTVDALACHLGEATSSGEPMPAGVTEGDYEPIAVVGMACRMPAAPDLSTLVQVLRGGANAIAVVPPGRWYAAEYGSCEPVQSQSANRFLGLLADVDSFDAAFFGIGPVEARSMDPQHRLLLEVAWDALEDAGYAPTSVAGSRTGVFVGLSSNDYSQRHLRSGDLSRIDAYSGIGSAFSAAAGRISYVYNLSGPSMTVDTACSSSLVALHLACRSLQAGECTLALAGGANLVLSPENSIYLSLVGALSPTGRCKAFADDADGYVRGEGCGLIVLKRLSEAIAAGDSILAVIAGSCVNQDGRSNGLTAPNAEAQRAVLCGALQVAGVRGVDVGYVEAHGTGTRLGDPIEASALGEVMGRARKDGAPLFVGSVKANIGHLEAAAGIAGAIKAVLALHNEEIPPQRHAATPSRLIPWNELKLALPTELVPWPRRSDRVRVAGVSSFGLSGTNAHVVLKEAPALPAPAALERSLCVLAVAARSEHALQERLRLFAEQLTLAPETIDAPEFCAAADRRCALLEHRAVAIGASKRELADELTALRQQSESARGVQGCAPREEPVLAFLYTGQGSQYFGMGRKLMASEPVFRDALKRCRVAFDHMVERPLLSLLYERDDDLLQQTQFTQPVLFVLQYALTELWASWGLVPDVVLGHSVGEFAAACAAGVVSVEDGLALTAARGKLIQTLCRPGAMIAVEAEPALVESMLADRAEELAIAAYNGPTSVVIAGDPSALQALEAELARSGIATRRIETSHGFHSPLLEPALDAFMQVAASVRFSQPSATFVSTLTGDVATPAMLASPQYWRDQLRAPVLFSSAVQTLQRLGAGALVEIGPHPRLLQLHRRCAPGLSVARVPSLQRGADDAEQMLRGVATLFVAGRKVSWRAVQRSTSRAHVLLPGYPFLRETHWIERSTPNPAGAPASPSSPLSSARERPLTTAEVAAQLRLLSARLLELPESSLARETDTRKPDTMPAAVDGQRSTRAWLDETVAQVVKDLLRLDDSAYREARKFTELGLDSLAAVALAHRLSQQLGVPLSPTLFFAESSPATLAAYLTTHFPEQLGRRQASKDSQPETPGPECPRIVPDPTLLERTFPLTELQRAYHLGEGGAFALGRMVAHQYFEFEMDHFDEERWSRAWQRLLRRHPMLQCVVTPEAEWQWMRDVPPFRPTVVDYTKLDPKEASCALDRRRAELRRGRLRTDHWPLFEVNVYKLDAQRYVAHYSIALVALDGLSTFSFFRDLARFYLRPDADVPDLSLTVADYMAAVRELRLTERHQRAKAYWLQRVDTLAPPPALPQAKPLEAVDGSPLSDLHATLSAGEWSALKGTAAAHGVTPSAVVCTAFAMVLARWSESPSLCINVLHFNRLPLHEEVNELVCNLSSTFLLETEVRRAESFASNAARLQAQQQNDLSHSTFSGIDVLNERNRRLRSVAPGMPVAFTSLLGVVKAQADGESRPEHRPLGRIAFDGVQTPQVTLDCAVAEYEGELRVRWSVLEALFPEQLIRDMQAAKMSLLRRLAHDPRLWEEPPSIPLPPVQRQRRESVNATQRAVADAWLHTAFFRSVQRTPDSTAIIAAHGSLSYRELATVANHIACWLQSEGASPNALVAVVMDKGWEQVAAVLGVLAAGAAYLPIDACFPQQRIDELLQLGEVRLVLTQAELAGRISWPAGLHVLPVSQNLSSEAARRSVDGWETPRQSPTDLAYVIFTSGSTGKPKGVAIDHRGAMNTIQDINQRFSVTRHDVVLCLSELQFDLSVYDIFGTLAVGGTLAIPAASDTRDAAELARWVERCEVTVWSSVPAFVQMLIEELESACRERCPTLRLIMMSGDWIPVSLPARIKRQLPDAKQVSLGGATEASIWSIYYFIDQVEPDWPSIPYGFPLTNQRMYVLDQDLEQTPDHVPGEIYIGGVGLAHGYWRNSTQTAASFVVHPRTRELLYRTGDRGCYLMDGAIRFLGRRDSQLKIQGYRIEPGEIEMLLRAEGVVDDCLVMPVESVTGEKELVAYLLRAKDARSAIGDDDEERAIWKRLEQRLQAKLPHYMVPRRRVFMGAFPLTTNGKIDRKRLPSPTVERAPAPTAPRHTTDEALLELWRDVLALSEVSIGDNFFDLGGHSISAVRLISKINQRFGRQLSVSTLTSAGTVAALADLLQEAPGKSQRPTLVALRSEGRLEPLFLVHPISGHTLSYHGLLPYLDSQRPVLGFEQHDSQDGDSRPNDVESLARDYVSLLRDRKPEGRYCLGGWSFGGIVAYEMARQLHEAGASVGAVILIDSWAPIFRSTVSPEDDQLIPMFLRDLRGRFAGLRLDDGTQSASDLSWSWQRVRQVPELAGAIGWEQFQELYRAYKRNMQAMYAYRPQGCQALPLYVIRATDAPPASFAGHPAYGEPDLGWSGLASVEAAEIDGDHYSIFREPRVASLARLLSRQLERATRPRSATPRERVAVEVRSALAGLEQASD